LPPSPQTHSTDDAMAKPGYLHARATPTFGKSTPTPLPPLCLQLTRASPFQRLGGNKGSFCKIQTHSCHSLGRYRYVIGHIY
jgi:hypothetical protein